MNKFKGKGFIRFKALAVIFILLLMALFFFA